MGLDPHPHFDTHMDPSCGLHKATNHILYWIGTAKPMVPKKGQKFGNTGLPCLHKPLGTKEGGGTGGWVTGGFSPKVAQRLLGTRWYMGLFHKCCWVPCATTGQVPCHLLLLIAVVCQAHTSSSACGITA